MRQFKVASWSPDKIKECKADLDNLFRSELGYGNGKRMDPRGVKRIDDNRVEIAETIMQLMQNEIDTIDPLPFLVQQVEGDIRNDYVWQELTGTLRVTDRAYGTKPLSQRLYFKEYSMHTAMREVAVEFALEEVFAGRMTPSLAAQEMAIAILRDRIALVLDAIDAGIPNQADRTGVSGYTLRYTVAGALTAAVLDKAIDGLRDEGDSATIFGRHVRLYPDLRAFSSWADSIVEDFQLRGVIGNYRGANIVTLRDPLGRRLADAGESHLIPTNKVWVAGSTPGALYMNKPVNFLNYAVVNPRDAVFSTGVRVEDGVKVWDPDKYRIITIT